MISACNNNRLISFRNEATQLIKDISYTSINLYVIFKVASYIFHSNDLFYKENCLENGQDLLCISTYLGRLLAKDIPNIIEKKGGFFVLSAYLHLINKSLSLSERSIKQLKNFDYQDYFDSEVVPWMDKVSKKVRQFHVEFFHLED